MVIKLSVSVSDSILTGIIFWESQLIWIDIYIKSFIIIPKKLNSKRTFHEQNMLDSQKDME